VINALSSEDLELINPNTRTCPIFNTHRDAALTRRIYLGCPVLHNEEAGKNPWGVSFLRMLDMTNDSALFRVREQLEASNFVLEGNRFIHDREIYLPLYESKAMHQFDHRHGTFEGQSQDEVKKGYCAEPTGQEYGLSDFVIIPRIWIPHTEVQKRAGKWGEDHLWFVGFRNVTRAVDRRTATFTALPYCGAGNSVPIILFDLPSPSRVSAFVANVNSFAFDYVVRQKMGGINLNFFIVKQLPVLPPDRYTPELLDFIVPRVVELTYTAWDLQPFAQDILNEVGLETWARWFESDHLRSPAPVHTSPAPAWAEGATPPPFVWDEGRRAHLRADLDALYAHLYGLARDELAYVLDTFPIVRRKDEAQYGEYRTKRMVVEAFESLRG
jgi:hypothetical protein